jgi:HSP20 family protein
MTNANWDWTRGGPYTPLRLAVDRLFEDFAGELPWMMKGWRSAPFPKMALSEDIDRFLLEAELPGVRMEDLEITCLDRTLTLRGDRRDPGDPEGSYGRRERPTGIFIRSLELPAEVDDDKITATLEDGVLRILIPKGARAAPRRIDVRPADPGPSDAPKPPTEQRPGRWEGD